jgi:hypothetical protein
MSIEETTYQKCVQCNGTGEQHTGGGETGTGPFPCTWPGCENGFIVIGYTEMTPSLDDLNDKLDDILDKCNDIFDAVS